VTTTNLTKPTSWRARWIELSPPVACAIVIFALLAIAGLVGRIRSTPAAAVPTAQLPIIIVASPLPVQPPTAVPLQVAAALPNTLRRAAVAYDSPNGNVIGAIEQGRAYQVRARFGADWLQADVVGSGVVWLRSADVLDLPDGLVDLAPPPAPQVVYVSAPAPPQQAPVVAPAYQAADAAPTPARYQVLNERQVNIQQHYVEIPTLQPMEQTDATQEWARQQYAAEHPEAGR
jgi:hypothetical protein